MTQPTTPGSGAELDAPTTAEPKKPEKASLLDDFMDIFYAPSAVFARRANSSFWIPLLIVSLLLGVIFFANRDLIDPIVMLMLGVVIWIVGKFFDAKQSVNAAVVVAVFSYVPRVVEGVVNRVEGL